MAVEIWLSLSAPVSSPWARTWQWRDSTEKATQKSVLWTGSWTHSESFAPQTRRCGGRLISIGLTEKMTTDGANEQKDPVHSLCSLSKTISCPSQLDDTQMSVSWRSRVRLLMYAKSLFCVWQLHRNDKRSSSTHAPLLRKCMQKTC